jgi:hypothetical protein
VPVVVYDGEQLNDGTIYLNRPEPLALQSGVEYELQQAGKPMGLFDVFAAGESQGAWRGFGAWKPYSEAKIKADKSFNQSDLYAQVDLKDDDKPVLKRKHPKGTDTDDPIAKGDSKPATGANPSSDSASTKNSSTASEDDPDRPKLKRKAASEDSGETSASSSGGAGSSSTASSKSAADDDPDRPVLKRKSDDSASSNSSGSGAGTAADDPDRPTIRRKRKNIAEAGMMETATGTPDPDRPRLMRGKPADSGATEAPRLTGTPPAMEQAVAVSDASTHTEHPWKYTWANPDDEEKMKSSLEDIARAALGLNAAVAPASAKPVRKTGTAAKKKVAPAPTPVVPAALEDEKFRVFELAYGSSATMVLTASGPETSTKGADGIVKPDPQKYVTLIAQPDLYGGVLVLYKSVTDSAHLDETPRMRLVDAVDVMGDNRGELLFELRGNSQRQFALYRVLRGSAEQLFATVAIP